MTPDRLVDDWTAAVDRAQAIDRARAGSRAPLRGRHVRLTGGILAAALSIALVPIGGVSQGWLVLMGVVGAPIAALLGAALAPHVVRGDRVDAALVVAGFGFAAAASGAIVVAIGTALGPSHGFGDDDLEALLFFGVYGLVLSPVATIVTIPLAAIWATAMRARFRTAR